MLCSYFPQEKLTVIKHEEMKMTPETLKLVQYKHYKKLDQIQKYPIYKLW
jgi:hypothetical protein